MSRKRNKDSYEPDILLSTFSLLSLEPKCFQELLRSTFERKVKIVRSGFSTPVKLLGKFISPFELHCTWKWTEHGVNSVILCKFSLRFASISRASC